MTAAEDTVKVGDRWIYTTPTGREVPHTVKEIDVKPKYHHKPGLCVRLVADDGSMPDPVMWPEDLFAVDWFRPADEQ